MQAVRTIIIMKPRIQQAPVDIIMPRGTALDALFASSDMWTQESKPPIVQMGESQESMKAQPTGHVAVGVVELVFFYIIHM